ncbi:MAG: helix-turn-helix domain-containing protein [Methanobrevibacter sp.]|jgi:transposase|nr:helix-turn-helix domain-containing protein [Candidatus Methanovirga procula]
MILEDLKPWHAPNIIKIPNSQKILIKHLSIYEINDFIKHYPDKEVVKIMIFLKSLYEFETIAESARKLGYRYETGLRWLERWNEEGFEGIKFKWGDGRPSKLTEGQLKELKDDIINMESRTTKQIQKHILDKWNVNYATSWLPTVLRSIGAKYGKPYMINNKEPENAEKIIQSQVKEIKKEFKDRKIDEKDLIFVFMDKCSFQNTDNSQKVWYFGENKIKKNFSKE